MVAALETGTADPQTARWMHGQVNLLRESVPEGKLGDHAPDEVVEPLRAVVSREIIFDQELVRQLTAHPAVEQLMGDVLRDALNDFVDRLRHINPAAGRQFNRPKLGLGGLRAITDTARSLGEGVLGGIGQEIEKQAREKIKGFVHEALSNVMGQVAEHLTDPLHAKNYGLWRAHILDTLLDTELQVLAGEIDKLDPEHLVDTAMATARTLARREDFPAEVAKAVRSALEGTGERSVRDFLQEAGIDEVEWRDRLRLVLVERGTALLDEPAFETWLVELLAD